MWSGGSYTKGNAGTGGWTGDASLGIGIEAGRHDTQDDDFATGINQCLNKDGSNSCTGDLNLGGFKPVNLAAGTAAAPAICAGGDVNTGIFSAAADQIGIATNGTERVRIDDTGRVGIGVTPTALFQIRRDANDVNTIFQIRNNSNGSSASTSINLGNDLFGNAAGLIFNSSTNTSNAGAAGLTIYNGLNGAMTFATAGTERMRIASTGELLINKASSGTSVAGSSFWNGNSGTNCASLSFVKTFSGTANAVVNYHSGAYVGGIDFSNTATSFPTSSDYRLKENVIRLSGALSRLNQLKPCRFNFIAEPDKTIDGFLAHEVADVIPNAVQGEKDAVKEDGTIKVQSLDHSKIVPLLTAAIQELNAKVEALEARVAELEAA